MLGFDQLSSNNFAEETFLDIIILYDETISILSISFISDKSFLNMLRFLSL